MYAIEEKEQLILFTVKCIVDCILVNKYVWAYTLREAQQKVEDEGCETVD